MDDQQCWFCEERNVSVWHAAFCSVRELFGGTPLTTTWTGSTVPGKAALIITLTTIITGMLTVIYANMTIWTN